MLPEVIKSGFQLLVEGNDQRNFFDAFTGHLSITNVQIQNFGGTNELGRFLRAFAKTSNFQIVQSLGIVRDAETCAINAFRSVQSSLKNAGLPEPNSPAIRTLTKPAVTALILPVDYPSGMLETVLCKSFAETPVDRCIDDFFKCVKLSSKVTIKNPDKARAHAYLTTKPKSHVSVGVAAKKGYWDLDHNVFSTVRGFLQTIATTPP